MLGLGLKVGQNRRLIEMALLLDLKLGEDSILCNSDTFKGSNIISSTLVVLKPVFTQCFDEICVMIFP